MDKSVLNIGAGIAGLAAGSYLQRNGFKTHIFDQHTHPDRLEAELVRLGTPEDRGIARALAAGVRSMSRFDMPVASDKLTLPEMGRLLIGLPGALTIFGKWMKLPITGLLARIRSPRLKEALAGLYSEDMGDFPVAGLLMMLGFMSK